MTSKNWICAGAALAITLAGGCSSDGESSGSGNYQDLVNQGWSSFMTGDYQGAINSFNEAKSANQDASEPYAGTGWSMLKLDQLNNAAGEFTTGSAKSAPSADLYAGWAFVLNAQKVYGNSNTRADLALGLTPNWSFSHGLPLSSDDLHVLKAENFFLLGDFSSSLGEVRVVNPAFQADVTTEQGQAELAIEIERLKSIS